MLTAQKIVQEKNPVLNSTFPFNTLNWKCDHRVTLKIDVSHTDHGHMIGRGGRNTKAIMAKTMTQIHYPDGNRMNSGISELKIPKSNLVSITGEPKGVEMARKCIRRSLPLAFCFDLNFHPRSKSLREVELYFDVQISCDGKTVCVKGNVDRIEQTKYAARSLIELVYGPYSALKVPVKLTIEVDPKNHNFLLRSNNNFTRYILYKTGAKIEFPDNSLHLTQAKPNTSHVKTNDVVVPTLHRSSTVVISGPIEDVVAARQLLIEHLPVTLSFDLTNDEYKRSKHFIQTLAEIDTVELLCKPKIRPPVQTLTLRCAEKNVNNLYEARDSIINYSRNAKFDKGILDILNSCRKIDRNLLGDPISIMSNNSPIIHTGEIGSVTQPASYAPSPQYLNPFTSSNLLFYPTTFPNPMYMLPTSTGSNQNYTNMVSLSDPHCDTTASGSMMNLFNPLSNMIDPKNYCSYSLQLPILPSDVIRSTPIDQLLLKVPEEIPKLEELSDPITLLKMETSFSGNASSESDAEMTLFHSSSQESDVNLAPGAEYSARQREIKERNDSFSIYDICPTELFTH